MKKNTLSFFCKKKKTKNRYQINPHPPSHKYGETPLLPLKKKSNTVAGGVFYSVKNKESQSVNLKSFGLHKPYAPPCKPERAPLFKTNNPSFERKRSFVFDKVKNTNDQFLHFLKSSSHFGRKSRHLDFAFPWHASMCNKFSGVRNQIPQISGRETLQSLTEAFYCIALVLRKGGKVLVVNKNGEFSPLFRPNTLDVKSPLVIGRALSQNNSKDMHSSLGSRVKSMESAETVGNQCRPATAPLSWVGGCLTNWKEISKSVATLLYFSKRFGRFIKQNNIHFPRFKKMKNSFQGFIDIEREQLLLKEKPQLLLLFNAYESQQILDEAIALQIPVVALTDSSTDLSQITYPIPINSDSAHLVHRCLSQLIQITNRQGNVFLQSKKTRGFQSQVI